MTLEEMIRHFEEHGVAPETVFTIGGLGGGEIDGIEQIDGAWWTYFSERGSKNNYRRWDAEEDAVAYIRDRAEQLAKLYGLWRA
ncbi:MAG: hypothetical protein AAF672_16540 [Pseudomonadota bacterium]